MPYLGNSFPAVRGQLLVLQSLEGDVETDKLKAVSE